MALRVPDVPAVKVKVKVQLNLEQATKTQRGSRGIALLFLGPRHSRWGWWGQPHAPAAHDI